MQEKCFFLFSVGLSTSNQSHTEVPLHDSQRFELPSAEVVSVVAPPSLEEVQQAVQEASEQVEGRGAEDVLKELLERVVEAALGHAEGGDEVNADEMAESDKQSPEEEIMGETRDASVEEETGNVSKSVAGEDGHALVDEALADLETGGTEEEEVDFIAESLVTEIIQEVVGESIAVSRETVQGGELQGALEEQVEALEKEVTVEGNSQESERVTDDVQVTANVKSDSELELGFNSSYLTAESERERTSPSADNYEIEAAQTVEGEPWKEENVVKGAEEQEPENDQGHLVTQGRPAEVVDAENTAIKGAEGGEGHGPSETEEESVPTGDQLSKEQISLESWPENNEEDKGKTRFQL